MLLHRSRFHIKIKKKRCIVMLKPKRAVAAVASESDTLIIHVLRKQNMWMLVAVLVLCLTPACDLLGPSTPGLVRRLTSVSGWIDDVAWSPDSHYLVAGSVNPPVRIWDVDQGQVTRTIPASSGTVSRVSWSPDGAYIALGAIAPQNTLQVWNLTTSRTVLTDSIGDVADVVWSPDGQRLAVASGGEVWNDGIHNAWVNIYDTTHWQIQAHLPYTDGIFALAWSPDSTQIAVGSASVTLTLGTIAIWDVMTGQHIRTYSGHGKVVNRLAWSPDGRFLASASDDHTAKVWDVSTGQNTATFRHSDRVTAVAWSPNGERLASGGDDQAVKVWEVASGSNLQTFTHPDLVNSIAWSPDGKLLAVGCQDGAVWLWNAK
jgi:WD40 repeat protein